MKIKDLNGFELEVTNLDEAIRQSEAFVAYSQVGGAYSEFNEKQKAYWSDLHSKLLTLKSKLNNENQFFQPDTIFGLYRHIATEYLKRSRKQPYRISTT